MSASTNEQIRREIDTLLDSGVDLDQVTVLESEQFVEFEENNVAKSIELLKKVTRNAMANARKIQEARELISAIK